MGFSATARGFHHRRLSGGSLEQTNPQKSYRHPKPVSLEPACHVFEPAPMPRKVQNLDLRNWVLWSAPNPIRNPHRSHIIGPVTAHQLQRIPPAGLHAISWLLRNQRWHQSLRTSTMASTTRCRITRLRSPEPAQAIDPGARAQIFKPRQPDPEDSAFLYEDTASSRADIAAINRGTDSRLALRSSSSRDGGRTDGTRLWGCMVWTPWINR